MDAAILIRDLEPFRHEADPSRCHFFYVKRFTPAGRPSVLNNCKWRIRYRSSASGTGLGLSIAKRIIEMHIGRIWVEESRQGIE
jgi:hypothetical protein